MRETSLAAYERIKSEGLLSIRRFEVYELTALHGPGTAGELSSRSPIQNRNNFATRLSELRTQGVVRECGEKTCSVTGHHAIVWETTDEMPVPFKRESKSQFLELSPTDMTHLRALWRKGSPLERATLWRVVNFVRGGKAP